MKATCAWCLAIVTMPDTFNPKDPHKDVICSPECARMEAGFRMHFSDQNIGERNLKDHGVNPNERGRNAPKKAKD